jgi:uncharacterized membrane protein YkoI
MQLIYKMLLISVLLALAAPATALQSAGVNTQSTGAQVAIEVTELATLQRGCVSLNEAVEQVRRQYNGRIVSAKTVVNGNREVHEIKVLTDDGKVKTVRVQGCRRD